MLFFLVVVLTFQRMLPVIIVRLRTNKRLYMKLIRLMMGIGIILSVGLVILVVIGIVKDLSEDSVMNIPYEVMELNRTGLYLKEGLQYDLNLQPRVGSSYPYHDYTLQPALREKTSWSSSDEEIASVDEDGVVTALAPGEVMVSARLKRKVYQCKVQVMSAKEDKEIPIQYHNNIFTKEIYNQIEKAIVAAYPTEKDPEITSRYGISFLYSMLAEMKDIEPFLPLEGNTRYGGVGMGFVLKDGRAIGASAVGAGEFTYEDSIYHFRYEYDTDEGYGKGYEVAQELWAFTPQLKKLEK